VQEPTENKPESQDKENKECKRQGNFPEKNTDRHGRHILNDEDNGKTGNYDEKDNLEIHLSNSRQADHRLIL
jgi:hypothetical protein